MVINYMFVRNSRLFRTLFFELEYHVQVHCPSTAGFIALLLHLFPSVKRFRLHRSWQASAMESLWGMIDSGVCNFQRCGLPYFRGGAPVTGLLSFICAWMLWSQGSVMDFDISPKVLQKAISRQKCAQQQLNHNQEMQHCVAGHGELLILETHSATTAVCRRQKVSPPGTGLMWRRPQRCWFQVQEKDKNYLHVRRASGDLES